MPSQGTYDYVVVGAGSAGATVAVRLSEDPAVQVLLLEAGPARHGPFVKIPLGVGKLLADDRYVWRGDTVPQRELHGARVYWPSGRTLGGSSSVNGMLVVRGHPQRYDDWEAANCPGWGFDSVLPAFMKLETYAEGDANFRGRGGPVNVSKSAPNPLSTAFIAACVESGIPAVDDYNDLSSEGAAHMQMNARNGLRCSTAAAYLEPAKHRRNLTVMPQSLATEICFDGKRATGVKFRGSDGSISHASARREVILSAGAIRSPQLLELSGVGNGALLQQLGVDLVHHNPHVGENLQDHLMVRLSFECTSAYTVNDLVLSRVRMAKALLRYALRRDGLIATAGICGTAFTRSRAGVPIPDVRLQLGLSSGTSRLSTSIETGLDACSGFHLGGYFIYPESRGSIHATSPDPTTSPVIDPHYLGSRVDQDTTVRVLKRLRQIAAQPSLARLIRRPLRHSIDATDEDLLEHARSSGSTCWHPIATCRMGSREDAVVDHKLRVHGLQGLRVADASVIPFHVSSNTNIPSVMIGERASDFIRQSARQAE